MDNRYHPFVAGMEKLANDIETALQLYNWLAFALVAVILLVVVYLFICELKVYKGAGKQSGRVRRYGSAVTVVTTDPGLLTTDHR